MSQINKPNKQPLELEHLLPSKPEQLNPGRENLDDNNENSDGNAPTVNTPNFKQPEDNLSEQTDWFTVAHQLRQHNRELMAKVAQLEQAIASSQEQALLRSPEMDTLITQQAEELNHSQEQINRLLRELETAQQTAQSQQLQIESFYQQLEATQAQLTQFEGEYTLLENNYNQQTQQLLESEKHIQELRSRLHRQQRYTLQYKAALDRYSQASSPASTISEATENPLAPVAKVSKGQPIQPWSIQQKPEQSSDEDNFTPIQGKIELDYKTLVSESEVSVSEARELKNEKEEEQKLSGEKTDEQELETAPLSWSPEKDEGEELEVAPQEAEVYQSSVTLPRDQDFVTIQPNSFSHLISVIPSNKKRRSKKSVELPKLSR